jgi:HEAT repeat protein
MLADAELSPAHQLELWRLIAGFSEWQLRGVDDGRFVLQREHARAAPLLAQALVDRDRYVRMHSAQALERMGKRAQAAGPQLLAALDDREIAPQVARSLGALGYRAAEAARIARLAPSQPLELRVAAARALGRLGLPTSSASLEPYCRELEPLDLRAALACALVECAPATASRAAIERVLQHLTSQEVESAELENALEMWLAASSEAGNELARATFDEWRRTRPEDPRERVAQRAELLRSRLDALFAK